MLNRLVLPALLALALVARADQSDLGQLDASPTLFTVMAALNAAGYDTGLTTPSLRASIRDEIAKRNLPSVSAIKAFVERNKRRTDAEELSQYISFALTAGPPPRFQINMRDVEIPPDVTVLKDFPPLLETFYKEADIDDLWRRSRPAINQYIERYHKPVSDAVLQVNSYLRQQTSGFRGSHFQILIELQAPPNIVQTRSYGYEYTVVVTPSPEPRTFDIRHAYLHYILDPLSTRYKEILDRKKVLAEHVARARGLDDVLKEDFLELTTECLIKAIEARLDHKPENIQTNLLEGLILTPYFAEHLPIYEKQEQAMLLYYPELVGSIDNTVEEARLSKVVFNNSRTMGAPVKTEPVPEPPPLTGAAKTLDEAEKHYTARDLDKAKGLYLQVLEQTDRKPLHAAAYYGLARIAIFQKDPGNAEKLFHKSLDSGPEAPVKAWDLIYLGRLSMAAREPGPAAKYFQDALNVDGASDTARKAATEDLQKISKK